MAKADSKRVNVRLKTAVRYQLEECASQLGCSETAAIEQAVGELHTRLAGGDGEASVASARADVAPIEPLAAVGGGQTCRHCGRAGQLSAQNANPFRACGDCAKGGHLNYVPCKQCLMDAHIQEQKEKSQAADTDTYDFGMDWGA